MRPCSQQPDLQPPRPRRHRLDRKPRGFFSSVEAQRKYLLELGEKLGIKPDNLEAWYNVTNMDLRRLGGRHLLGLHNESMSSLLSALFPEHKWDTAAFSKKPQSYWSDIKVQREFILDLGRKLGIEEGDYEAWYKVPLKYIKENGGNSFMRQHKDSKSKLLLAIFPEHKWDLTRFPNRPRNYWQDVENQRQFLTEVSRKLGFQLLDREAWKRVTFKDLVAQGGGGLLTRHYKSSVSDMVDRLLFNDTEALKSQSRSNV